MQLIKIASTADSLSTLYRYSSNNQWSYLDSCVCQITVKSKAAVTPISVDQTSYLKTLDNPITVNTVSPDPTAVASVNLDHGSGTQVIEVDASVIASILQDFGVTLPSNAIGYSNQLSITRLDDTTQILVFVALLTFGISVSVQTVYSTITTTITGYEHTTMVSNPSPSGLANVQAVATSTPSTQTSSTLQGSIAGQETRFLPISTSRSSLAQTDTSVVVMSSYLSSGSLESLSVSTDYSTAETSELTSTLTPESLVAGAPDTTGTLSSSSVPFSVSLSPSISISTAGAMFTNSTDASTTEPATSTSTYSSASGTTAPIIVDTTPVLSISSTTTESLPSFTPQVLSTTSSDPGLTSASTSSSVSSMSTSSPSSSIIATSSSSSSVAQCSPTFSPSNNILLNPGFEGTLLAPDDHLNPWSFTALRATPPFPETVGDSSLAHCSNWCIGFPNVQPQGTNDAKRISQVVDVIPGAVYTVSMWYAFSGETPNIVYDVAFGFMFYDGTTNAFLLRPQYDPANPLVISTRGPAFPYRFYSYDYTIPVLVTRLRLAISLGNNAAGRGNVTGVVYADDISMVLKSLPMLAASTTTVE